MKRNKRKANKNMPLKDSIRGAITQPQSEARGKTQEARLPHILSITLILLISIAIYSNTLKNGFVYDDEFTIVNNTLIKNFSNLSKLFTKEYFTTSAEMSYRPVVTFTYFLDYALYGIKPWGYHLTNLLLHTMNGVLLYIFLTLLIQSSQSSIFNRQYSIFNFFSSPLLISLIFVTHPILTEAVNAISFREDLLAFLFYISALILYIYSSHSLVCHSERSEESRLPFVLTSLSCLFYLLSLLSKEMAITLPLTIFIYEWLKSPYSPAIKGDSRGLFKGVRGVSQSPLLKGVRGLLFNPHIIGYIAVTCFYLYLRFYLFHNPIEENIQIWSLYERLMTLPYLLLKYIMLLIAPISLSADYVITPVQSLISLKFIIPFIIIVLLIIVSLIFDFQSSIVNRQSVFGILFLLLTLLPVYNIIPIVNPFAERYLYLPMVGFAIVIGLIVQSLIGGRTYSSLSKGTTPIFPLKKGGKGVVYFFFLSILIIYSLMVVKRNTVWNDGYSLWSDTTIKMPESSKAHNNLGNIYNMQGRLDEALKELKLALFLKPDYADAHFNLGAVYEELGQFNEAIKEYQLILKSKNLIEANKLGDVYNNLGNVYYKQGRLDDAIKEYLTAIRLKPDYANAYNNLGFVYYKQGRLDDAIKEYLTAIRLKPDLTITYRNLGLAYGKQHKLDEAIDKFLIALKLNPDDVIAHYNLGLAYNMKGLNEKAIEELEFALKLKPDYLPAREAIDSLRRK